jgi:beta-glucosidase
MASKKKMSNRRFRAVVIPVVALVTVLCVGVTIAAQYWSASLDTYLGKGERRVQTASDVADWDAEYYDQRYDDTDATDGSISFGAAVNKSITDEGIVLMRNEDAALPLAQGARVTPFGYRYLSPVYGGSGSGNVDSSADYVVTAAEALGTYFDVNTTVVDAMQAATAQQITATEVKPSGGEADATDFSGADTSIYEYDPAIYDAVADSAQGSTGVVFLGRMGGEGGNLQQTGYADGTAHGLALTPSELGTVKVAKEHTDRVVAVINSSNVLELGPLVSGEYAVDAIVWIGGPGSTGFASLADVLVGAVNPSGRTADVWDADLLANPATANFGPDRTYSNTADTQVATNYQGLYYIEYEEGLYYGYRYYETAADLGMIDYDQAVVYPFGYGLSYTTFEQRMVSTEVDGDEVRVSVEVTNTGDVDGKEVVQVYYAPPYTALDAEQGIERPSRTLAAFDKVEVAAGATEQVELTFSTQDMAGYSAVRENPDGTVGAYVLEAGDYGVLLGKDSHDTWAQDTVTIGATTWFDSTNPRQIEVDMQSALADDGTLQAFPDAATADPDATFVAASNQFGDSTAYMADETTVLTRADWAGTQPTTPTDKALSDQRLERATVFDPETDPVLGDVEGSEVYTDQAPTSGADNGLVLSDLRGKGYYDPAWDELLDQIDYTSADLDPALSKSAFLTPEIAAIGKPESIDHDGPQGWNLTGADGGPATTAYASEVVVASTWNTDLAYDYGEAIGQEALTIGYTGWYGPGLNIHRSPFGGRNFEYYSEDALLSGAFAAGVISGAGDQGVVSYVKHFGMNEYEGPATALAMWATEQTIREVYLRPYQIAMRDARMTIDYIADDQGTVASRTMRANTALMCSAALIDGEWTCANHALLTDVVRGEWGFQGMVSTDMFLQSTPHITDKVFRAGGDSKMWFAPSEMPDLESATGQQAVRRAIKDVAYAYANSNLMQGAAPGVTVTYATSPWKLGLWGFDALGALVVLGLVLLIVRRARDERRHPERYRNRARAGGADAAGADQETAG